MLVGTFPCKLLFKFQSLETMYDLRFGFGFDGAKERKTNGSWLGSSQRRREKRVWDPHTHSTQNQANVFVCVCVIVLNTVSEVVSHLSLYFGSCVLIFWNERKHT